MLQCDDVIGFDHDGPLTGGIQTTGNYPGRARNMQKALMYALLQPNDKLKKLQDEYNYTELFVTQEELKTLPYGEVWEEYLSRQNVPGADWYEEVKKYEKDVLSLRK